MTIIVSIILGNGYEGRRITVSSQFFHNLYMIAVYGVVTEIGDK